MKTRNTMIGVGVAAALAAGVGAYSMTASAQDGAGYGPGMMDGYGSGMMMGRGYRADYSHMLSWGGGPGAGQWNCPAFSQNDEPGSGPGDRHGEGYGPAYHMRDWRGGYGPGMMQGYGYGMGNGPGYDRSGDTPGNQTLNLTTDEVKSRMERWLTWRGNPRLKVGEVKEKDADSITADILTKDNSLVERFIVDRHTGLVRRDNS